jgi:hypothetical protein
MAARPARIRKQDAVNRMSKKTSLNSVRSARVPIILSADPVLIAMGHAGSSVHDMAVGNAYQAFRTQVAVFAYSDVFLFARVVAFAVILSGTKGSGGGMAH